MIRSTSSVRITLAALTAAVCAATMALSVQGQYPTDPRTDFRSGPGDTMDRSGLELIDDPDGLRLLRPLEQGVGDVTFLGRSLRQLEAGLGAPSGFTDVYQVPGRPGWFMRVDGGLYAVFRRSLYDHESHAVVPDDTTFYIGLPSFMHDGLFVDPLPMDQRTTQPAMRPLRAEEMGGWRTAGASASSRHGVERVPSQDTPAQRWPGDSRETPSIIQDSRYRADRMVELMKRAAEAEQAALNGTTAPPPPVTESRQEHDSEDVRAALRDGS